MTDETHEDGDMAAPPPLRMRRRLSESVEVPIWPDDVHLRSFSESLAADAHALLKLAYANGGGSIATFEEWWHRLQGDGEYHPTLCIPAFDSGGHLIGFAQCWTTAFVKDLVVHPGSRCRGIGRALLLHVFHIFKERGANAVELKVRRNNSAAIRFYDSLGMSGVSDGPLRQASFPGVCFAVKCGE